MIIGLCGRLCCGKTELSKICEKHGYEKLYFALPLKQLCADILGISIEELNQAKRDCINISLFLDDKICEILSEETEIPLEYVKEVCFGKTIETVREMLQFIGTDLIREYNSNWHVNRVRAMIDPNKDYVFDDVRFPNEKKMIEELGGDCWFIVRPKIDNVSNHVSENSITWHDCYNRIIINDHSLSYLLFKWDAFIDRYAEYCKIREKEFQHCLENGYGGLNETSLAACMMIHKDMFTYVPKEFVKENIKKVTMNEDNSVFVTYKDDSMEMIDNTLVIEDLKIFL